MRLHATEAGTGGVAGPPAVLLHGLFGSAGNWGAIQKRLAQRGRRVIALDLRNHGASPHDAAMDYATMAADVSETLAALGALPAAVIGHSMGGKVAMRLALDRPDALTRLLVADVAPVRYEPHFRAFAAAMQDMHVGPGLSRATADAMLAGTVGDRRVRTFLLQNLRLGGPDPGWRIGLDQIAAALPDIEGWEAPEGARYGGPVLFLTGGRSDYVLPEYRDAIRTLFPRVRFVTLREAGHWLHADDPAGFVATVEAFLEAAAASATAGAPAPSPA